MANNVTAYGRQQVEWPDLGSDPGVTLHSQIVAAVGYLSNNVTGRWSGAQSFSIGQTIQIEHNFGQTLANLKIIVVENGIPLDEKDVPAVLTFSQIDTNTISVENVSGVSKTYQLYVYPHKQKINGSELQPDIDISTTGLLKFGETLSVDQNTDSQTGTAVTLAVPTKMHVVLTGVGLASVQGITAPSDGMVAIFTNSTGGVVSFSNDAGTAANRLLTGTGADLQLENNASLLVKYDTVSSKWRVIGSTGGGSSAITVEQAHSFVVGNVIYFDGSSYQLAQASNATLAEVVGVVSKVIDADTFQYLTQGEISGLVGLSSGQAYFLSPTVAGGISTSEPTTIGEISLPVGVALSSTKLLVRFQRGVSVGSANVYTQALIADGTTYAVSNIQDVSTMLGGELNGVVNLSNGTAFFIKAQFAKSGSSYFLSYQTSGVTPPNGFEMIISTGGVIQIILSNIAANGTINYSINSPNIGTNLPLSIGEGTIIADGKLSGGFTSYISPSASNLSINVTSSRHVYISSPVGIVNIDLPAADIDAGYQYTVVVRNASESSYVGIRTSSGTEIERISGSGKITLMALAANPTTTSNWQIVHFEETGTLAASSLTFTATGGGTVGVGTVSNFRYYRRRASGTGHTVPSNFILEIALTAITITGTVTRISCTLPARFANFNFSQWSSSIINDNGAANNELGLLQFTSGSRTVSFQRASGSAFTASSALTQLYASVSTFLNT